QQREMLGVSWAWSPGTNGPLAGDIVYMNARTEDEFNRRFRGKLRGAWVMMGAPYPIENPSWDSTAHADSIHLDSLRRAFQPHTDDERQFFGSRTYLVSEERPA